MNARFFADMVNDWRLRLIDYMAQVTNAKALKDGRRAEALQQAQNAQQPHRAKPAVQRGLWRSRSDLGTVRPPMLMMQICPAYVEKRSQMCCMLWPVCTGWRTTVVMTS